jgi:hypothetical protein
MVQRNAPEVNIVVPLCRLGYEVQRICDWVKATSIFLAWQDQSEYLSYRIRLLRLRQNDRFQSARKAMEDDHESFAVLHTRDCKQSTQASEANRLLISALAGAYMGCFVCEK